LFYSLHQSGWRSSDSELIYVDVPINSIYASSTKHKKLYSLQNKIFPSMEYFWKVFKTR